MKIGSLFVAIMTTMLLVGSCVSQSKYSLNSHSPESFLYKETDSNRADLFDMKEKFVYLVYLKDFSISQEFGRRAYYCTNEIYYCIDSGDRLVIPRTQPFPKTWSMDGVTCVLRSMNANSNKMSAVCKYTFQHPILITYSVAQGVVSYQRLCDSCDERQWTLVGEKGLFGLR